MINKSKSTKVIAILNGPNLNILGSRQPEIYGKTTIEDIEKACIKKAKQNGFEVDFYQTNIEGELVSKIQESSKIASAIIINAAAYTHTSVAILDALSACQIPVIEVHLSNIFKREEFRHKSFVSQAAQGVICGFGLNSYLLAIDALSY